MHHRVRSASAAFDADVDLGLIFAPALQPRQLEDAFQNHLAPGALCPRFALQCVSEVIGIRGHLLRELLQIDDFRLEREAIAGFVLVGLFDLQFEMTDAFA